MTLTNALPAVFTRERIAGYAAIMRNVAEEAVAPWRDGQVLAVDGIMNDLALTALTRSLFKFTPRADTARAIQHGVGVLTQGLLLRTVLPSAWEKVPTPGNLRFRGARRTPAAQLRSVPRRRAGGAGGVARRRPHLGRDHPGRDAVMLSLGGAATDPVAYGPDAGGSTSAAGRRAISPSAMACICASGRRWRASAPASPCPSCSAGCPGSRPSSPSATSRTRPPS
ncbi:hypothetical protein [Inquilinus sp.]|jgi:hypothetical protein|uniref:hypothetical protein n=1 Tax=Inquilinus sp. TaxID=1932117 RepID=UPI00378346D5